MDIGITLNGSSITEYVIEYTRDVDICTGVGAINITLTDKMTSEISMWDTIVITEEGNKKGTFYVCTHDKNAPNGTITITAQDASKRMVDYFISEQYTVDYPTSARYWIIKFLTEAGVSYHFNTASSGAPMSLNMSIGLDSVYNIVINMIQISGWYMYFDEDGVCNIGKLSLTAGSWDDTYTDEEVLSLKSTKSDEMLRNRVVVWGKGEEGVGWIYADTSSSTGWTRGSRDIRTIVYANPNIKTYGIAYYIAAMILKEFSQLIPVKEVSVPGAPDMAVGNRIIAITDYGRFGGMITLLTVEMSDAGLITHYTLDKRCPRLFAYVDWNGYVYAGTENDGVYRKLIIGDTWYPYNTGLPEHCWISDLAAYDGLLTCVTRGTEDPWDGELYILHTSEGVWRPYKPVELTNIDIYNPEPEVLEDTEFFATACSINRRGGIAGTVTAVFAHPGSDYVSSGNIPWRHLTASGNLSWVVEVSPERYLINTEQIYLCSGITDLGIVLPEGKERDFNLLGIDIETIDNNRNLITIRRPGELIEIGQPSAGDFPNYGWFEEKPVFVTGHYSCPTSVTHYKGLVVDDPPYKEMGSVSSLCNVHIESGPNYALSVSYLANSSPSNTIKNIHYYYDTVTESFKTEEDDSWSLGTTYSAPYYFHKISNSTFSILFQDPATSFYRWHKYVNGALIGNKLTDVVANVSHLGYLAQYGACTAFLGLRAFYAAAGEALSYEFFSINMDTGIHSSTIVNCPNGVPGACIATKHEGIGQIISNLNYLLIGGTYAYDDDFGGTDHDYYVKPFFVLVDKTTGEMTVYNPDPIKKTLLEIDPMATGGGRIDVWGTIVGGETPKNPRTILAFNSTKFVFYTQYGLSIGRSEDPVNLQVQFSASMWIPSMTPIAGDGIAQKYYPDGSRYEPPEEVVPSFFSSTTSTERTKWCTNRCFGYFKPTWTSAPVWSFAEDSFDYYVGAPEEVSYGSDGAPDTVDDGILTRLDGGGWCFYNEDGEVVKSFADTYGGTITIHDKLVKRTKTGYSGSETWTFWGPVDEREPVLITGTASYVMTHDILLASGNITPIMRWGLPLYVEAGQIVPTAIYDLPMTAGTTPAETKGVSSILASTLTNEPGEYEKFVPQRSIYDARIFTVVNDPTFPILETDDPMDENMLERFIGISAGAEGLNSIDAAIDMNKPWEHFRTHFYQDDYMDAGTASVKYLDFTNDANPYIFVYCVTELAENRFFQRNQGESTYVEYSAGLPESLVTILRADDIM